MLLVRSSDDDRTLSPSRADDTSTLSLWWPMKAVLILMSFLRRASGLEKLLRTLSIGTLSQLAAFGEHL